MPHWRLHSHGSSLRSAATMQAHTEVSPILPVQVGFNARAALQSCELATLGVPPTRAVFEGPYGYLALFEGAFELHPVLDSLGLDWCITHSAICRFLRAHGGIEGVMALRTEHK